MNMTYKQYNNQIFKLTIPPPSVSYTHLTLPTMLYV